ncbi:MAG TPA: hypothetical protein VIK33_11890 [Anaerolineae bacterium]
MTPADLPNLWANARKRYPQHAARIDRAQAILHNHFDDPARRLIMVLAGPDGLTLRVKSQAGQHGYHVTARGCTCPDWPRSHRCKHYIAGAVFSKLLGFVLGGAS